jgi:hypothetical protein
VRINCFRKKTAERDYITRVRVEEAPISKEKRPFGRAINPSGRDTP